MGIQLLERQKDYTVNEWVDSLELPARLAHPLANVVVDSDNLGVDQPAFLRQTSALLLPLPPLAHPRTWQRFPNTRLAYSSSEIPLERSGSSARCREVIQIDGHDPETRTFLNTLEVFASRRRSPGSRWEQICGRVRVRSSSGGQRVPRRGCRAAWS